MDFESEWKKVPDLILQFENELKNKRNRVLWYPNLFHHLNYIFLKDFQIVIAKSSANVRITNQRVYP